MRQARPPSGACAGGNARQAEQWAGRQAGLCAVAGQCGEKEKGESAAGLPVGQHGQGKRKIELG